MSIPRGCRRQYIPTWHSECDQPYNAFLLAGGRVDSDFKAEELTSCLDRKRRERWIESIEETDFTHSSKKAWKTFNPLTGRCARPRQCPVPANATAYWPLANGLDAGESKCHSLNVKLQCSALWKAPRVYGHLTSPFTSEELVHAIKLLKCENAQGPDNIPPAFLKHLGRNCLSWLREFYSSCLDRVAIPKIWREATVIAVPKPNKPMDDPRSYRPISLLCVPYKLLEHLLLFRLEPVVNAQLPTQQGDFRSGRSTVQQDVKLTSDIEESYERRRKAGLVLVDLTAAYDTVWHQGLALKLLQTIPDRHLVRFIVNIISNRSFILKTSEGKCSRLRRL